MYCYLVWIPVVSFFVKRGHGFAVGCVEGLGKKVLRIDSGFAAEGS